MTTAAIRNTILMSVCLQNAILLQSMMLEMTDYAATLEVAGIA